MRKTRASAGSAASQRRYAWMPARVRSSQAAGGLLRRAHVLVELVARGLVRGQEAAELVREVLVEGLLRDARAAHDVVDRRGGVALLRHGPARRPRAGACAGTQPRARGRAHGCHGAAGEGCLGWRPRCVRPGTLHRHGPDALALRAGLPRRAALLARRQPPGRGPAGRRRGVRAPAPVAAPALRRRLRRLLVAEGVRRPRRDAGRAGALRRGDGARSRAPARERARHGHGRTRGDPPRHATSRRSAG